MSDVSVIGLGRMGSALAHALLASGRDVAVWNRSPEKVEAFVAAGAAGMLNPAAAVAAGRLVVICLSDYAASFAVLREVAAANELAGRLIVQLTSGTSAEAREMSAWAASHEAAYLDGAISAWPSQIGGPEAAIIVSGEQALYDEAAPVLTSLAGGLTFVGADVGHAKALFSAALAYFAGHWIGFAQGAAICQAEGLDTADFGQMMARLSPMFAADMQHMGRVIAEDGFSAAESTIASVERDIRRLIGVSSDLGVETAFPRLAADIFQRARDEGFGGYEHSGVIKVLRNAGRAVPRVIDDAVIA
ncbi:3-hydroxyisobutyrate dehydrogenase [Sphingomonas deserti]|uniref:3-hydroxyisobutyrate dehydrogenase n=2 Tax=Allosphingosinicella deserti TaxID=2116704 RepID=A0A2P7R0A1_9SPHN|nr:NAD(P)-binding domain-containing protein [Sphingomonas deserti]PSJ43639.1 3-hydroxyisobutyrate dehydrogenase [Sphingomonas deserti]